MRSLSAAEVRWVALAAQGVPRSRTRRVTAKVLHDLARRQGVLQIDSVNILARAHEVPAFSRLGPYDRSLLDRLAYRDRLLYEGWSHVACLIPIEYWRAHQWRRELHDRDWHRYVNAEWLAYADRVLEEVRERGPLSAGELSDPGKRRAGSWWNRSSGKQALEYHFGGGRVAVTNRRSFERVYDLAERVIPAEHYDTPAMTEDEAKRLLVLDGLRALGVGTAEDIGDYFRLKLTPVRKLLRELVAAGEVEQIAVEGWATPAYVLPTLKVPRRAPVGHALLNPFDPVVWYRQRTERLFDFHYRIEIYVPEPKRIYGYYVLPFLVGDQIVARVDLKADRVAKALRVFSSWIEPGADVAVTADALAEELALVAEWLELANGLDVQPKGTLAKPLATAVKRR